MPYTCKVELYVHLQRILSESTDAHSHSTAAAAAALDAPRRTTDASTG